MAKICRIVITGGPCSGKSEGIKFLKEKLEQKGYKVLIVSEAATELGLAGILHTEFPMKEFEELIIDISLVKERTLLRAAEVFAKEKDVVILHDRGLMDIKAYISEEQFYQMLDEKNLNEEEIKARYDGIVHLVTTAIGAEEHFSLENNEARTESLPEARDLDMKLRNSCWNDTGETVIDNSTGFEEKKQRLLEAVLAIIANS